MTTRTLTLADFLLARISEAEQTARRIQAVGSCEPAYSPARMMREVAAKRKIVERLHEIAREANDGETYTAADVALVDVVGILASVYADHPDFNAAWS
jgi:replicative DNA helicase